jgi:hypothetical protein
MFMKAGCFISGNTHPARWKAMHYNSHMCKLLSCTHLDASFPLGANDDQVLVAHHAFNGQTRSTCLIPLNFECRQCVLLLMLLAKAVLRSAQLSRMLRNIMLLFDYCCSSCMIGNLHSQGNTVHVMCSTI